jgi:hypothetical protein
MDQRDPRIFTATRAKYLGPVHFLFVHHAHERFLSAHLSLYCMVALRRGAAPRGGWCPRAGALPYTSAYGRSSAPQRRAALERSITLAIGENSSTMSLLPQIRRGGRATSTCNGKQAPPVATPPRPRVGGSSPHRKLPGCGLGVDGCWRGAALPWRGLCQVPGAGGCSASSRTCR